MMRTHWVYLFEKELRDELRIRKLPPGIELNLPRGEKLNKNSFSFGHFSIVRWIEADHTLCFYKSGDDGKKRDNRKLHGVSLLFHLFIIYWIQ